MEQFISIQSIILEIIFNHVDAHLTSQSVKNEG